MRREEFQNVVYEAMENLPEEFSNQLENIEIIIEDNPQAGINKKTLLLGLYQGVPLEKRGHYYAGVLPDRITLFQKNIERISADHEEMVTQIQKTLLHELGHYFGITERRLRELGY